MSANTSQPSPLIFVCDHAVNTIPQKYGTLGLTPQQLNTHMAYDPGALSLSQAVSKAFNAPLVASHFSRLLIDPNRGRDDPTLIPALVDQTIIPANAHLTPHERENRLRRFYAPYHDNISTRIDDALAQNITPILISIHTFTPIYKGQTRDLEVGFLYDTDLRALDAMNIPATFKNWNWAFNKPYDGVYKGDTLNTHATARGLAHVLFEFRNDLLTTEPTFSQLKKTVTQALNILIQKHPNGCPIKHHPSRAR